MRYIWFLFIRLLDTCICSYLIRILSHQHKYRISLQRTVLQWSTVLGKASLEEGPLQKGEYRPSPELCNTVMLTWTILSGPPSTTQKMMSGRGSKTDFSILPKAFFRIWPVAACIMKTSLVLKAYPVRKQVWGDSGLESEERFLHENIILSVRLLTVLVHIVQDMHDMHHVFHVYFIDLHWLFKENFASVRSFL